MGWPPLPPMWASLWQLVKPSICACEGALRDPIHWQNWHQQIRRFLPSSESQCLAFMPISSMWTMQNTTETHKMKHLHIKVFWSHKLTNVTVKNIPKVNLSEKNTPQLLTTYEVFTEKYRLSFKIINKFKFGPVMESMYRWHPLFCYLCNGLVQAEGGIQLFSFCCMYRKKSFREKARILWERNKKPFRIPHWFPPSNAYWILFRGWKILQIVLKFCQLLNLFHWSN